MKKTDIFAGKYCFWAFALVAVFLIADIFTPDSISNILWAFFFLILGASCLWNYKNCGRVHCQITGYGFLAVGVLALLSILEIIKIDFSIIWLIFILILVIGYGIEYRHKGKTGTCYRE